MIRGVLFDMDGVLLDTERLGARLMPQIARALGYAFPDDLYFRMIGADERTDRALTAEAMGEDYPYDEVQQRFLNAFIDIAQRGELPMKAGVAACLAGLQARGIPCALATSTRRSVVDVYLQSLPALQNAFRAIVCGEEVAHGKPAPDIFWEAAHRLDVPYEACIGVEDSRNGLTALRAAGIRTVMVPDLLPYDPSFAPLCDHVLSDLTQLCPLIDRLNADIRVKA